MVVIEVTGERKTRKPESCIWVSFKFIRFYAIFLCWRVPQMRVGVKTQGGAHIRIHMMHKMWGFPRGLGT